MCVLEGICIIRFRSCLQLYWEYRQKGKSRGLEYTIPGLHQGYTIPTHWKEKKWSCSSVVLQPIPHALEWDHAGRRQAGTPRTPRDTLPPAGCHTLGHVWCLFRTAPKPASLHRFHPAQPVWFLPAEPAAFCSALFRSALSYPITSQLGFALPFWPEHSPSSGGYRGVLSAVTLVVYYTRGVHMGNCTAGLTAAGTLLAFALRLWDYVMLGQSEADVTRRHSSCAVNSWMFQNTRHVEKSAV